MGNLRSLLIAYAGEDADSTDVPYLNSLLESAVAEIRRYLGYERSESIDDMIVYEYGDLVLRIAKFHFDKGGKEGVASFTENGVQINYDGNGTPRSYFKDLNPVTKVI